MRGGKKRKIGREGGGDGEEETGRNYEERQLIIITKVNRRSNGACKVSWRSMR